MARPPNPGEVTEAGVPLTWAWVVERKAAGKAIRSRNATEAGIEWRTEV
jgi:hypothetical protein